MKKGIERIRTEALVKPVRVNVNENVELDSVLFGEIQAKKSTTAEIPFFAANIMEKRGLLEIVNGEINERSLKLISWSEKARETKISQLPDNFYLLISEAPEEKKKELEPIVVEIINLRIKKILKYVLTPSIPLEILNSMSPEEKFLFHFLKEVVDSWKKEVVEVGAEQA